MMMMLSINNCNVQGKLGALIEDLKASNDMIAKAGNRIKLVLLRSELYILHQLLSS